MAPVGRALLEGEGGVGHLYDRFGLVSRARVVVVVVVGGDASHGGERTGPRPLTHIT